jgi:ribosome recycling factor
MAPNQIADDTKKKLQAAVDHFQDELKKLRTGRASAAMLDGVTVEAYGTQMPLNQVATVTAPEAQLLQISPFDPTNMSAISTAIRDNPSLGLNPSDDGHVIRIPIPPLTEERRRDIVRIVGQKQEDCMISLRGARHDAFDSIDRNKKDKQLGEDEAKRLEKQIDDAMSAARTKAEAAAKAKEQEILTL